ncbi:MAG: hypothetical protein AMXMBFR81_24670 [Chthonomonas sp.]
MDIPATAYVADGGVDGHLQSPQGVALAEAFRRVSPVVAELMAAGGFSRLVSE